MNIAAPVSMLAGKGSGPALLVVGLLVAVWLAQRNQLLPGAKKVGQ